MSIQLLFKQVLYKLSIVIIKLRKNKITGVDLRHDLQQLIQKQKPIIIDVGANSGQSIELFRELWSRSIVHSFEPSAKLFETLTRRFLDDHIHLNNLGMGSEPSKGTLLLNQKSGLNSLLEMSKEEENRFKDKKVIGTEDIIIETVDNYVEKNKIEHIHLLKTDTQGFDLEVLKGAQQSVANKRISNVLIEINFISMYQNQGKSTDIINYLFSNGFGLVALYEISRSKQSKSIDWCTALFTLKNVK
jgi:FkbM family methyltransferase